MRAPRLSVDRPLHADGDPYDDGPLPDYLQPVLLFTVLFVAWFFPPSYAATLVGLLVMAYASPLLYDPDAVSLGYPVRTVIFTVTVTGLTFTMQFLKRVLVQAEMRQREMAERDPLTAVSNRRGFDHALAACVSPGPSARRSTRSSCPPSTPSASRSHGRSLPTMQATPTAS